MAGKNKSKRKDTAKCGIESCGQKRAFYWEEQQLSLCYECWLVFFSARPLTRVEDDKEARTTIQVLANWLDRMRDHGEQHAIKVFHPDFMAQLDAFAEELEGLQQRLAEACRRNAFTEFAAIKELALALLKRLEGSEAMASYKDHKIKMALGPNRCNGQRKLDRQTILLSKEFVQAKGKLIQEMEKKLEAEVKRRTDKIQILMTQQYQEKIVELETQVLQQDDMIQHQNEQIQHSNEIILQQESNIMQMNIGIENLEVQVNRLEEEKNRQAEELESKQVELKSVEKYFFSIYKQITNRKVPSNLAKLDFVLWLDNPEHQQLLSLSKFVRLPDCGAVRISGVPKADPNGETKAFLHSVSKTNVFEWHSKNFVSNVEAHWEGLEDALSRVAKETILNYWKISKGALERLVKASASVEKLTIRGCKLGLEEDLDFSGPEYKIAHLRLPYCGYEVGDDWNEHPEKLDRLLKAIKNCGLKDSLRTLVLWKCGIAVEQIKKMLADNELGHLKVEEEKSNSESD